MKLKINTLHGRYHDKDEVILHAAFQCLINYVEIEKPKEIIDWSFHPGIWEEIESLYQWWTVVRSARQTVLDSIDIPNDYMTVNKTTGYIVFNDDKYPDVFEAIRTTNELEREWYEEDTNNLIRLIKIRGYLWT
jgi:hypothetical protein